MPVRPSLTSTILSVLRWKELCAEKARCLARHTRLSLWGWGKLQRCLEERKCHVRLCLGPLTSLFTPRLVSVI